MGVRVCERKSKLNALNVKWGLVKQIWVNKKQIEEFSKNEKQIIRFRFSFMMTSSNENIFRVTGPLCGEFTGPGEFPTQRPVTRSFDVFFDLLRNKRLSKQPWGWWFATPSWSLWRHRNVVLRNCFVHGSDYVDFVRYIHDGINGDCSVITSGHMTW